MIKGKKTLGVILARGGSVGIPHKNMALMGGHPLIRHSIEASNRSKSIDMTMVSTDDDDIAKYSHRYGQMVDIRPDALSTSDSPGIDTILYLIRKYPEYEYIVALQPTNPFRTADHIEVAIQTMVFSGRQGLISVRMAREKVEWCCWRKDDGSVDWVVDGRCRPPIRQGLRETFRINGAIYLNTSDVLLKEKRIDHENQTTYLMGERASFDIDTPDDLFDANAMAEKEPIVW
jgi:CMP-N,N'-diacetyllegionaminic acid synthase